MEIYYNVAKLDPNMCYWEKRIESRVCCPWPQSPSTHSCHPSLPIWVCNVQFNRKGVAPCIKTTIWCIPTIKVMMGAVPQNIPALMLMDVLLQESLIPDTVENTILKKMPVKNEDDTFQYMGQWHVPMYRLKSKHL